ncbi:amidohydrolase family protein [Verticiella sediminum]|uniref:Amidohydrolase family protein n=1 Tax=Verticiella sediminum TaxID=1247510 RepID=A0A556AMT0_9BURK|nr:amidohydrolase family protein [Verticiella sediminum]TSH94196.1 amidohydrolase family protein [Verticiella sediminum]
MTNPKDIWLRAEDSCAPHSSGSAAPESASPAGAVDCHHHIFDVRFQKPGEPLVPPATVEQYRQFKRRLGLARSVFVVSSNYGDDPACLLDGLEQLGQEAARGVALVYPEVTDTALDRLDDAGVRGIRVYFGKGRTPTAAELRVLAGRIDERGWSMNIVGARDKEVLLEWESVLAGLACPLVIDHLGWIPQPQGRSSATAALVRRLLCNPRNYLKLSGPYLSSRAGSPDFSDVDEVACELADSAPRQMLWGSDWPHPVAQMHGFVPDGARLFDQLTRWVPDPARRRLVLVDNPERLYWAR